MPRGFLGGEGVPPVPFKKPIDVVFEKGETSITVTKLAGSSVRVRVTQRLPHPKEITFDLTQAEATELGKELQPPVVPTAVKRKACYCDYRCGTGDCICACCMGHQPCPNQ